eukprot:15467526-Alexandrium_andersonii.AAC.1
MVRSGEAGVRGVALDVAAGCRRGWWSSRGLRRGTMFKGACCCSVGCDAAVIGSFGCRKRGAGGRGRLGPGRLGRWSCAAKRLSSGAAPSARGPVRSIKSGVAATKSMGAVALA